MTQRKVQSETLGEINPDTIYRTSLSPLIFGYGPQRTRELIRSGELPMPAPLSPSSRFDYWTGRQILDHRAEMQMLARKRKEAERTAQKQTKPQPPWLVRAAAARRKAKLQSSKTPPPQDAKQSSKKHEAAT